MNKVGKYVIISLLLLLGLGCVGILYLFFIPNSTLFNITYINLNETIKSEFYLMNTGISEININSRSYDVNILPTKTQSVYVKVYSNSFGFVLKENSESIITSSVKNNTLTFNIKEPHGFATKNSSYINLYIPEELTSEINLNLSNKNALTKIDSEKIIINNLSYSTQNGDFNFNNGKINNAFKLNLNKSTFTIGKNVITNNNTVDLKLTTGKFYAENSVLGDVTINKNERGVISVKKCKDFNFIENKISAGGQIYVQNLSHMNVKSKDTIIEIGEIIDANIDLTGAGSVKINQISNISYITTDSGNITIQNCSATAILHTDTGNINVKNATKIVSIQTNYGDAKVAFSLDAENYTSENQARTLYAKIYNGKLTATGVEHLGVANNEDELFEGVSVTGNGRVNITMNDVCGENAISGNNGNVQVVVNHSSEYILTTSSNIGAVRVNLLQISESGGYKDKNHEPVYVNCTNSSNYLSVSTNQGDLTLLDTIIFENGF